MGLKITYPNDTILDVNTSKLKLILKWYGNFIF
jgi:hypothetical protein